MTNREKYTEEILDIACNNGAFAVDIKTNKPIACSLYDNCKNCLLVTMGQACDKARKRWSEQEYTEPPVDWSKVEVDTPILVTDLENCGWRRRHFAKYDNGVVYSWTGGRTSWTTIVWERWNFAKLVESEVDDH